MDQVRHGEKIKFHWVRVCLNTSVFWGNINLINLQLDIYLFHERMKQKKTRTIINNPYKDNNVSKISNWWGITHLVKWSPDKIVFNLGISITSEAIEYVPIVFNKIIIITALDLNYLYYL